MLKVGERVVGLDIGMGLVDGDTHGDEVLEGGLELGVKLDSLGHGKVVELVGEHDGPGLMSRQTWGPCVRRDGDVRY